MQVITIGTALTRGNNSQMTTINDVAVEADVSIATVSRVIHNKPHVRPEMRQRVLEAIDRLGYQPSRVARSLRVKKSSIIGVIITDVQNTFFTNLARAVEDVAYNNGYAVFLCNSDEDPNKEDFYLEVMRAENVAGIIISPTHESDIPVANLVEAGIPVVCVDRQLVDTLIDTVIVDNVGGSYRLIRHLIKEHDLERIAIITGPKESTTGRQRLEGYQKALAEANLPLHKELIKAGSFKEVWGYSATRELLALKRPPAAIFAANNLLARGAMRAIFEAELRVPEDIALVAFDEIEWAGVCRPKLTYVRQSSYELGKVSAELIYKRINGDGGPVHTIILTPELSIGDSCGCMAGGAA